LRSLALKGCRFKTLDELTQALDEAVDYWNAHGHPFYWHEKPQDQVTILGGFGVSRASLT
jgi:hypothetical protein